MSTLEPTDGSGVTTPEKKEEVKEQVKAEALEKTKATRIKPGSGAYVPRSRKTEGQSAEILLSAEKKVLAEKNQLKMVEGERLRTQERDEKHGPHRKTFVKLRLLPINYASSVDKHELDPGVDIETSITSVSVNDVDFGTNSEYDSGMLFRITLPAYKGKAQTIIGALGPDQLKVFHVGPSGGGQWKPL